jgi:YVTN family beta-propeller protein
MPTRSYRSHRSWSIRSASLPALAGLALLAGCRSSAAASPPRAIAYVSSESTGEVALVDVARARLEERIPVGKRPRGLRLSPDGRTLFVALSGSPVAGPHVDESKLPPADRSADGIAVVDLRTRRLERVIASGQDPESFDLSRDGKKLYVSNEETAEVSVVDVASGTVRSRIKVGLEPEGVTTRPDGRVVYVTDEGDGDVRVIDTATDQVIATIPVGPRPRAVVFSADSSMAFVSVEQGAKVAFVDSRDHHLIDSVDIPPGIGHVWPMGLALSGGGRVLNVTGGRGQSLAAIDVASRKLLRNVEHVGKRPWGVASTPDGATLVTANGPSADVSLVDARTGAVRARVPVGGSAWGVVIGGATP